MNFRPQQWTSQVFGILFSTLIVSCGAQNLEFYLYPQALSAGIAEVQSQEPLGGLEVVGYLPDWKINSLDPAQVRHLTDLVYFSVAVQADGKLATKGLTPSHLNFLQKVKREYGIRVILGITDFKSNGSLAQVASSPSLRVKFAKNLADYLQQLGFDGADIDWEYPSSTQMPDYENLLCEVKIAFSKQGYRLSVALSPSHPLTPIGYEMVDRVHGMMYDDEGKHATLEKIIVQVEAMIRHGVEPSKLQLGLPFYGRGYTAHGPKWSQALSYKDLQERFSPEPQQDTASGYYFNGLDTIRQKVRYAKAAGLSGIMVWEIGQDTTDSSSLLNAITEVRQGLTRLN